MCCAWKGILLFDNWKLFTLVTAGFPSNAWGYKHLLNFEGVVCAMIVGVYILQTINACETEMTFEFWELIPDYQRFINRCFLLFHQSPSSLFSILEQYLIVILKKYNEKINIKFKVFCCIWSPYNQKLSFLRHININSTIDCEHMTLMES